MVGKSSSFLTPGKTKKPSIPRSNRSSNLRAGKSSIKSDKEVGAAETEINKNGKDVVYETLPTLFSDEYFQINPLGLRKQTMTVEKKPNVKNIVNSRSSSHKFIRKESCAEPNSPNSK